MIRTDHPLEVGSVAIEAARGGTWAEDTPAARRMITASIAALEVTFR